MSATWDSKGVKATPIAADEILIIDTADSRNQKRATLTSLPAPIPDPLTFTDGSTQMHASTPDGNLGNIDALHFNQLLSVTTAIHGVFFKPDGTKMFVLDITGTDHIDEYDLSIPWDISTGIFSTFGDVPDDTNQRDFYIRSDGLKVYTVGITNDKIYEYNLSTAWDISTISFLQESDVLAGLTAPLGLFFRPDGLKAYVANNADDTIHEFDLAVAWNISTLINPSVSSISSINTTPESLSFKSDGTKMYLMGSANPDSVLEFELSTPWGLSTANHVRTFDVSLFDTACTGIFTKPDLTKLYIAGTILDSILEFDWGQVSKGIEVSRVGVTTQEIFTPEDLPMPAGGVITLENIQYVIKNDITLSDRLDAPNGTRIRAENGSTKITYTGSNNTFLTVGNAGGGLNIQGIDFEMTGANVEFLDSSPSNCTILRAVVTFSGTGTQKMATLVSDVFVLFEEVAWFGPNEGITASDCSNLRIEDNFVVSSFSNPGTDIFWDVSILTQNAVFRDNAFILNSNESAFGFAATITAPILLVDNRLPAAGDFFKSGVFLDQTSPFVTSVSNNSTPDSRATGEFNFLTIASPERITITATNTAVAIASGIWTTNNLERMTVDGGDDGIATITAIETAVYQVSFFALFEKLFGGSTDIAITVLINGVDVTTSPPHSVNSGIIQVGSSELFSLSTGDTVQLAVINFDSTDDITVSQAGMTIVRTG